jgi:hypothetical protein
MVVEFKLLISQDNRSGSRDEESQLGVLKKYAKKAYADLSSDC